MNIIAISIFPLWQPRETPLSLLATLLSARRATQMTNKQLMLHASRLHPELPMGYFLAKNVFM